MTYLPCRAAVRIKQCDNCPVEVVQSTPPPVNQGRLLGGPSEEVGRMPGVKRRVVVTISTAGAVALRSTEDTPVNVT